MTRTGTAKPLRVRLTNVPHQPPKANRGSKNRVLKQSSLLATEASQEEEKARFHVHVTVTSSTSRCRRPAPTTTSRPMITRRRRVAALKANQRQITEDNCANKAEVSTQQQQVDEDDNDLVSYKSRRGYGRSRKGRDDTVGASPRKRAAGTAVAANAEGVANVTVRGKANGAAGYIMDLGDEDDLGKLKETREEKAKRPGFVIELIDDDDDLKKLKDNVLVESPEDSGTNHCAGVGMKSSERKNSAGNDIVGCGGVSNSDSESDEDDPFHFTSRKFVRSNRRYSAVHSSDDEKSDDEEAGSPTKRLCVDLDVDKLSDCDDEVRAQSGRCNDDLRGRKMTPTLVDSCLASDSESDSDSDSESDSDIEVVGVGALSSSETAAVVANPHTSSGRLTRRSAAVAVAAARQAVRSKPRSQVRTTGACARALQAAREAKEELTMVQRTRLSEASMAPDPTLFSIHNTTHPALLGGVPARPGMEVDCIILDDDDGEGHSAQLKNGGGDKVALNGAVGDLIRLSLRTGESSKSFKVRTGELLQRLMDQYRSNNSLPSSSGVELHFDGEKMLANRTLASYEVEDGDLIDVVIKPNALSSKSYRDASSVRNVSMKRHFPGPAAATTSFMDHAPRIVLRTRIVPSVSSSKTRQWSILLTDKLQKLVDAYRREQSGRFSDGDVVLRRRGEVENLDLGSTPLLLGLQENEVLDMLLEYDRHSAAADMASVAHGNQGVCMSSSLGGKRIRLKLRVNGDDGTTTEYSIGSTDPFQKLLDAFQKKSGRAYGNVFLTLDGERLNLQETCQDEDLEGGEIIDVIVK